MLGYNREPWEDAEAYYVGMERPDKRYWVQMEAEVWPTDDVSEEAIETIELGYDVEAGDEEEAREIAVDRYFDDMSARIREGEFYDHPGEYEIKEVWCES